MRWIDLLRMSISSLRRRKLRTFLTVLGVVIGTASIVVMISLGLGLQQSMYEEVEQNGGTTSLTVTGKMGDGMYTSYSYGMDGSSEEPSQKYVTDDLIEELRGLEHVKSANPVLNVSALALKGRYIGYLDLYGMTPEELKLRNIELEPGGKLPDPDSAELELVVGNGVITNFYEESTGRGYWETGELPDIDFKTDQFFLILDQDAYYNSQSSPSVGTDDNSGGDAGTVTQTKSPKKYVVHASGVVAGGVDTYNANSYSVFCDINVLKSFLQKEFRGRAIPGQPTTKSGKPYRQFVYSSASVQADDMDHVEELADTIRSMGYDVSTNIEYINSMKKQFAMVQGVLGGIGAVSLFVAAIGITNTMMMSIYERTKEIGVMKVIGCSLKNIRQMFLLEAAFIGFMGGVAGNILSFIMSAAVNFVVSGESMGVSGKLSYIPPWLALAALGFAVLVGMAAGYFPARRAMRLSPLAAIRNE
ncbi:MAG TPA: ABC transporter permease [Candidatus Mediterraneibacter norfolkensis]|nr:ABC transporter permease [Candidatus Mediterraneibacter norfolkensis]